MNQKVGELLDAAQNTSSLTTSKLQQIVANQCSSTTCSLGLSNTVYYMHVICLYTLYTVGRC